MVPGTGGITGIPNMKSSTDIAKSRHCSYQILSVETVREENLRRVDRYRHSNVYLPTGISFVEDKHIDVVSCLAVVTYINEKL